MSAKMERSDPGVQGIAAPAPPVKRRRGRPAAPEQQRDRIVQAAARVFATKGYETSSLSDLAREIGISKAAIYHYFTTKQEIYDAIIIETLVGLVNQVGSKVSEKKEPADKLATFMREHAAYFERHHNEFVSMLVGFNGMAVPEFKQEAMRLRSDHEQLLRCILEQGVKDGSFPQADPVVVGRAVLSMLNWMVRWFRPGGAKRAEDFAQDYYDLLIGGISQKGVSRRKSRPPARA